MIYDENENKKISMELCNKFREACHEYLINNIDIYSISSIMSGAINSAVFFLGFIANQHCEYAKNKNEFIDAILNQITIVMNEIKMEIKKNEH